MPKTIAFCFFCDTIRTSKQNSKRKNREKIANDYMAITYQSLAKACKRGQSIKQSVKKQGDRGKPSEAIFTTAHEVNKGYDRV